MGFPITGRRRWYTGGVLLLGLVWPLVSFSQRDVLQEGFANPPKEARLRCYWWWLNGNTTQAAITRDLEEMKAKGYGGALLVDAGGADQRDNRPVAAGPTFGSPEWRVLYRHALQEAARLGLEISLNIQSGWNLGGPMVKPEEAAKLLTWSRVAVHGPADLHQPLAQPPERNGWYREIAVLAYPLRHGPGLPARPIRNLRIKAAFEEAGFSVPVTAPLMEDVAAQPGEEDAPFGAVEDVTASMVDGQFTWHAPVGDWEILRIGYTNSDARVSTSSGAWQGLAIDYLDRAAFEHYWRDNVDPLLADARQYPGALRYLVTDSWELGGINWTAAFRQHFRSLRGYDLLPYLPVIAGRIIGSRETSNRFLNDFRRTVGDLIVSQHYAVFADLANRAGLGIHPESGGPHGAPIDALATLGVSAFPQTEFWARSATHRTRDEERFFVKEGSSAAHTYGKTVVAAEAMTSIGPQWEETIWDNLKPTFDQAACEGLNRLIWHTFTSSPKEAGLPGQEYFAGTHLNPNVTWWNEAGPFFAYINRASFLLQQGRPMADVVYYYGDNVPNFVRLKSSDPAKVLPGYDYDVADENVLVHRMSVRDGRIVLPDGVSYRLLVLPDAAGIAPQALRAVHKLVADGAMVLGSQPRHATGIGGDDQVASLTAELWGDCTPGKPHHFGKGTVYCGDAARDVLQQLGVQPDFDYRTHTPGALDYVHRAAGDTDLYFVRNTLAQPLYAEVFLRSRDKAPELWHADTGATEPQALYTSAPDGRTRIPLWLEPYGSVFLVLRRPSSPHAVELSKDGTRWFPYEGTDADGPAPLQVRLNANGTGSLATASPGRYRMKTDAGQALSAVVSSAPETTAIGGPWTVRFTPGWGAPPSAAFPRLLSWTEMEDPGIRYYSGTATYSARFSVTAGRPGVTPTLVLDLGEVRELAQVRVNGKDLGILWKRPFTMDVSAAVKPGWNNLEVAVTNLWPNRLIGDERLPLEKRLTRTNITKYHLDSPLLPSGLLGPVALRSTHRADLSRDSRR